MVNFQRECKQVENTRTSFGSLRGGGKYRGSRSRGLRGSKGYRGKYSTDLHTYDTFMVLGNPKTNSRWEFHDKWIKNNVARRQITNNANEIQNISKSTGEFVAVSDGTETKMQGKRDVAGT